MASSTELEIALTSAAVSTKTQLLGLHVRWDQEIRKLRYEMREILPVGTFVRLTKGYYAGFYAQTTGGSLDVCHGPYVHLQICRKDRDGWINNDRMDARRYYRVGELDYEIDPQMLEKLKEAYPVVSE